MHAGGRRVTRNLFGLALPCIKRINNLYLVINELLHNSLNTLLCIGSIAKQVLFEQIALNNYWAQKFWSEWMFHVQQHVQQHVSLEYLGGVVVVSVFLLVALCFFGLWTVETKV